MEECTGGKSHVSGIHRNQITVCDENGNEVTDSAQFFLQKLSRNDESSVFPYRIKKPEIPLQEAAMVYFLAKEECEKWGIWISKEAEDKIPDSSKIKGLIKQLMKEGYLYLKKPGVFCVDPELSDEAAMEELYVKRKGKRIGSYYWESAAYRAGIITKKPKVEYILCSNSKRNMFRMERIGQTNVKVRAPYAKITDQNCEVLDALNLLIYAGEHPEH